LLSVLLAALPSALLTNLSPGTNAEYNAYLAQVEPALVQSAGDKEIAPWLKSFSGDVDRIRKGELPVHTLTGKNGKQVRDGIVHDWVGGVLIPGVTIQQVFAVIQDFDQQKKWYPEVIDSKLISKQNDMIRSRWLLLRKKLISLVFETELESRYTELSPGQWLVRSATTSVSEIDDYGTSQAKKYPQGQGFGFMWRFNSYWNLQERPEGVFCTLRVISLSRQVPTGFGWIVNPFIRSVPMETVQNTLLNTRTAVKEYPAKKS